MRIPNEEILMRLLQMGVVIEEYAEEKSAFILGTTAEDEFIHDVLFDSLVESETHRDMLIKLMDEIGENTVDKGMIEELVKESVESSIGELESDEEILREQLRSEKLAYNFYDNLIEACRNSRSNIREEKLERVLSTLEDIREDEAEDAQKIEEILKGAP